MWFLTHKAAVGEPLSYTIRLSDSQLDGLANLKANVAEQSSVKPHVSSPVYTHLDFQRSSAGSKNVEEFLLRFLASGHKLLDAKGANTRAKPQFISTPL